MKKILSMATLMMLGAINLNAGGTAAGTTIANTASLSFSVSGVQQNVVTSNEDSFLVDKKIDFLLENTDAEQIQVVPGSTAQITTWSITNEGNIAQKFTFSAAQLTGNELIYGDADSQDSTGLTVEYNNAGTWTALTTLNVTVDGTVNVRIKTDIDDTRVDGDVMNISLTALAVDAAGAAEIATATADTKNAVDIVLAEGAGATGDVKENGTFIAWGGYIVGAPNLSLTKSSCVVKDPINGISVNAKRIPGATVLYILDIYNVGTSTDAVGVTVSDVLAGTLNSGTITNLKEDDGQASCACTNGSSYGGGSGATNSGAGSTITIGSLGVAKTKHNCVSFEVDIL